MNNAKLLLIEGQHGDNLAFAPALQKKGFIVERVSNGSQALTRLRSGFTPHLIVVNAATLRTSGKRICQSLRENAANLPLLLILDEDREVENGYAETVLSLPFTAQKLVNRIRILLPGDGKNSIRSGPIHLDFEKHMVRCQGRQARLTPRLVQLLKAFMENPGAVFERKVLFSQVWETNYTEDMRTLDVHISWLRQAIEIDPDSPKFLITIRGVGYRLDV